LTKFNHYIQINKESWNQRTPIHINSDFYNNNDFIKGENSLKPIELNAIGNVQEKSLLHLQCHFGQDSISFARIGAEVTAIDFSDIAINEAKKLSKATNTHVNFIESDVLNLNLNKKFDIVFASYGTIGWLPDLSKWATTISTHLKSGGIFLLTEFHPFLEMIKDNEQNYFYNPKPNIEIQKGTYTDGGDNLITQTCWWNHSLTDIFKALESKDLKLILFEEFDYSPFCLEGMIKKEDGKYILKKRKKKSTPYVFTIKAIKK